MIEQKNTTNSSSVENTGFVSNENVLTGRYINNNGSLNVDLLGINRFQKFSIYHYLLMLPLWRLLLMIVLFYSVINLLFAFIYVIMGIHHLQGVISKNFIEDFVEAYFFSSQTLTTVGYGRVSPVGLPANIVASLEALLGIMSLALMTGLLYARFTRPKAYIKYSKLALIAPFREGNALMVRLAPRKINILSEITASIIISLNEEKNGVVHNNFYTLPLQLDHIMSLASSWTLVHPIDELSPLYKLTKEEIDASKLHIMVFVRAFDEGFSNTVVSRTEYMWNNVKTNFKFTPMFQVNENGERMQLDLRKIDAHVKI